MGDQATQQKINGNTSNAMPSSCETHSESRTHSERMIPQDQWLRPCLGTGGRRGRGQSGVPGGTSVLLVRHETVSNLAIKAASVSSSLLFHDATVQGLAGLASLASFSLELAPDFSPGISSTVFPSERLSSAVSCGQGLWAASRHSQQWRGQLPSRAPFRRCFTRRRQVR